ncbi:MAG TPA: carboxylesterase family protein [Solirubrobacteraceae bacterium]|nr:carboxylesterase family protein [Solirubrobacteraceae bacterium]
MPVVEIDAGRLEGRRAGDGVAFEGIPYATARRFAPPGPVAGWAGVREALRPGPAAPQPRRPAAEFTHGDFPATDEQCLSLNVFAPGLDGPRPVFVWIHGGGFAIGHASASLYAGERLASAIGAVVVTVNYRLGSLGWLGHADLAAGPGGPAANWGLLDQVAALEWVRRNVAAFGGDPDQVTLAGQSAGALSAMDMLVAPRAAGLFRRVVLQSPPLGDVGQPCAVATAWAEALSAAAGGTGTFDATRLRSVEADELVALHEALLEQPAWRGSRGGALPTVDPGSLPSSPLEVPGASPDVDVLVGHNADEGTFFFDAPWRPAPPPERVPDIVAHLVPGEDARDVLDRYHGDLVAIATDAIVAGPVARWAEARAEAVGGRSAVYRYRVDYPGAGPQLRATHTVEVPLLFGTWHDGGPGERLGGQAEGAGGVSAELTSAWRRFVHGESPGWAPAAVNRTPTNSHGFTLDTQSESVYSFPRWAQLSAHEGET